MNVSSIRFKLIVGGILIVFAPLAVSGYVAKSNSAKAVTHYSKANAQSIAEGLAMQVAATLEGELKFAASFAGRTQVKIAAEAVSSKGIEGAADAVAVIRKDMQKRFEQLRATYDYIVLTDAGGTVYSSAAVNEGDVKDLALAQHPLFQEAKTTKKAVSGEVARSKNSNESEMLLCAPVYSDSGTFLGAFAAMIKMSVFADLVTAKKIGSTGYCFMSNASGIIIAHPDAKNVLQLDLKTLKGMEAINNEMMAGKIGAESYVYKNIDKVAGYAPVKIKGWSIAATQNADEFLASVVSLQNTIALITLVSIILAGVLIFIAATAIIRPINKAIDGLKDIAQGEGDLTMRLAVTTKDEVGELAKWFNLFIEKLQGIIGRISENTRAVNGSINELSSVAADLSKTAEDTSGRANSVATAAEEMSANLNSVAAAMEESTTNTNMVASAAEEMTSTISQIAQNAEQAHAISEQAVQQVLLRTQGARLFGSRQGLLHHPHQLGLRLALSAGSRYGHAGQPAVGEHGQPQRSQEYQAHAPLLGEKHGDGAKEQEGIGQQPEHEAGQQVTQGSNIPVHTLGQLARGKGSVPLHGQRQDVPRQVHPKGVGGPPAEVGGQVAGGSLDGAAGHDHDHVQQAEPAEVLRRRPRRGGIDGPLQHLRAEQLQAGAGEYEQRQRHDGAAVRDQVEAQQVCHLAQPRSGQLGIGIVVHR